MGHSILQIVNDESHIYAVGVSCKYHEDNDRAVHCSMFQVCLCEKI